MVGLRERGGVTALRCSCLTFLVDAPAIGSARQIVCSCPALLCPSHPPPRARPQIVLHGLPIRPVFAKKLPPQPALRRQLGMERQLPAILLVGGGEGMGKLEQTVDELDARLGSRAQVGRIPARGSLVRAAAGLLGLRGCLRCDAAWQCKRDSAGCTLEPALSQQGR